MRAMEGAKNRKVLILGITLSILVFLMFNGMLLLLRGVNGFFSKNRLEFPPMVRVDFNFPVRVVPRTTPTPTVTPKPKKKSVGLVPEVQAVELSDDDVVANSKYPKEMYAIWTLESGRGTARNAGALNVYCANKGMTNEFGYNPSGKQCFDTFEDSVRAVERTLAKLGIEDSVVNALCSYNLGSLKNDQGRVIAHANCNYYQKYIAL